MKYLIITGIFALGISLGYVVGTHTAGNQAIATHIPEMPETDTEVEVEDTDEEVEKPAAEITRDSLELGLDSLELTEPDSLAMDAAITDTLVEDEDLSISREKLIKSVRLPITYLSEEEAKDTLIRDLLGIEEVQVKSIFVEFWESPLNFEGYKLSKKKMIIYGMSPQFDYKIYKRDENYYLAYQNVYYKMKETQDFLPFTEVSKSEVFND